MGTPPNGRKPAIISGRPGKIWTLSNRFHEGYLLGLGIMDNGIPRTINHILAQDGR